MSSLAEVRDFLDEVLEQQRVDSKAAQGILALQNHPRYTEALAASQDLADRWLANAIGDSAIRQFAGCLKPTVRAMREIVLAQGTETPARLINKPLFDGRFPREPASSAPSHHCAVFPITPFSNSLYELPHTALFGDSGKYGLQAMVLEDIACGQTHEHATRLHLLLAQGKSLLAVRYTYLTIEPSGIATWTPFEVRLRQDVVLQHALLLSDDMAVTEQAMGTPHCNIKPFQVEAVRSRYGFLDIGTDIGKLPAYLQAIAVALEPQLHL